MKKHALPTLLTLVALFFCEAALAISPSEFDAYETASRLSWSILGPPSAQPQVVDCPSGGSACLQNVSSASGPAPFSQMVFNQNQWSGNYFEIGVTGLEVWLHNTGQTDLEMRVGITNDPDGPNTGVTGTCFVSTQFTSVEAGDSVQVRFGLTASHLSLAANGGHCGETDSLEDVLSNVTQLRLYSAAGVSWTPDAVTSTLLIDNVRLLKGSATQWLWVGIKGDPDDDCPTVGATGGDWLEGHLFGDTNDPDADATENDALPDALKRFCTFRLPPGIVATAAQTQRVTSLVGDGLVAATPDLLGVTSADSAAGRKNFPAFDQGRAAAGGPVGIENTLYEALAERFGVYAGRPANAPLPQQTGALPTRLVVIDTQPNSFVEPDRAGQTSSLHGITMMRAASWLTCDPDARPEAVPDFTNCVTEVIGRVALAYRCLDGADLINPGGDPDSCRKRTEGGYTGSIAELARVIWDVVRNWKNDATAGPLILNGSLRWDVLYGGDQTLVDNMPPVVQAAHAAIIDARCRGALPIFAAGNQVNGPGNFAGPALPGLWETRAGPSLSQCDAVLTPHDEPEPANFPTSPTYYPLLYAVGGVQPNDKPLANSATDAEPRIVAIADHAAIPPVEGPLSNDPLARHGTFTGTSVATAVVSATAAAAWHYRDDLAPFELMNALHASGKNLNRAAEFHAPAGGAPTVRRVKLCEAVSQLCEVAGTANCPATVPTCATEKTPTDLSPSAVETALCAGGGCATPPAFDMSLVNVCTNTDPSCPGEMLCYAPGNEPIDALKCPHLNYYSTAFRTATNPAPEDQPCPMCTNSAHSPGILHGEIDNGWGGTYDDQTDAITQATSTLRGMTLKCDNVNYSIPETAINPVGGARFTLRNVAAGCADAAKISLEFAVADPATTADPPYDGLLSVSSPILQLTDGDDDGILDFEDNCTVRANPGQEDTDGDGIGNRCDGDIALNDCLVNPVDLSFLRIAFLGTPTSANWNPDADFNSDDVVNPTDLGIFRQLFLQVPGPSSLPNDCGGAL